MPEHVIEAAKQVLEAYLQSVTGRTLSNMSSREVILSDAMSDLALKLKIGWWRDAQGEWHYDVRPTTTRKS